MNSNDWVSLDAVAELVSTKVAVRLLQGKPYFSTENMLPNLRGVISAEQPSIGRVNGFKPHDTLFSNIRPYFRKVHYAHTSGGCSADVLVFRSKDPETFDPTYLYYCLANPAFIDYTMATCKGAKMPRGDKSAMTRYQVLALNLEEQKKVAGLLRAMDDIIDGLRTQSTTLEAIAQGLFRSWFVNFDPVRAKAAGRDVEGIPSKLAELFPASMEDSEHGEIPNGWRFESLDKRISYLNGLALQKFPPIEGEPTLPVIKIAQLRAGRGDPSILANRKLRPDYIIKDGDIIFSWSGSLEIKIWVGGEGALNQHLFKVHSASLPPWFCYCATMLHLASFRAIAADKATTMGHIQRHHLTEAKVAMPADEFICRLSPIFEPLYKTMVANGQIVRQLEELRDHLLPRLVSGTMPINTAELMVAEAMPA